MHLVLQLCLIITFFHNVILEQVVLLDTTKEPKLEWTRYPHGSLATTPGWVEESFTNFEKGINWRSYVVCDVAYHNVNNWLWTPFVERGVANRLYIEVKFTIRDCSLFPGNALSCKETFSLLYYEFDAVTREPPPWEPESYKLIGRIAAGEGRFNTNTEVIINTEIKSIAVTKKGVYFAFRDQGACISVLAIKVYYVACPAVTINFAHFNETPTGKEVTVIEHVSGICVENSEIVEPPAYLCKGDGKWTLPTGGCRCKVGYEPDFEKQTCNECPHGTYRTESMETCLPCPLNSNTDKAGSSSCTCIEGYSKTIIGRTISCTRTPSPPANLTKFYVDSSSVVLTWNKPKDANATKDSRKPNDEIIVYSIKCFDCDRNTVYKPRDEYFTDTKISLSNLHPLKTYRIRIFSKSIPKTILNSYRIKNEIGLWNHTAERIESDVVDYAEINITTSEPNIKTDVINLRIKSVTSTSAMLTWNTNPVTIEHYEVRWFPKDKIETAYNLTSVITKENNVEIVNLTPATEYAFQIRSKSLQNIWSSFTTPIYGHTAESLSPTYEDNVQVRIVAGIVVAVVFSLVVCIVGTVFYLRTKGSDDLGKDNPLKIDYVTTDMETAPIVKTIQNNMTTGLYASSRIYIDPHTYEDPNQAIREFAREIDASCISIEAIIGGGEFGDVCRGKLKIHNFAELDVAIKTLKPGSTDKSRFDFLTEASIMGQFEHPNVIYLQGVVTRTYPVMIITEFMENGSLDTFLRANDGKFQILQLVGMLRGISCGMAYLSEMSYVHRDLAARNVLVNSQLVCKIADFGLSREMECNESAYTTRGGKIPVRWTAPEAIAFRKFTSASDVWSFGIVLWEVMSYGERPYWNWSNQDVIKSIDKGYRLPAPMECPEALYQLMLDCWQKQRTHRPVFSNITITLDNLVRCPEVLKKMAIGTRATSSPEDDTQSVDNVNEFKTVDQWLNGIKMGRYIANFTAADLTTASQISRLTATQLSNMGITLVGHQKKILHKARQLENQI
ncbi:ephrin type-B receptor 1-B [Ctenocephalides felis]|uniref:ephrin type-B receptor 1-B n=1 Tax=Ctenocephalides felis TaxID=7515 RepID=UPI000E6E1A81|nr:ephrin type-B receptor 1-B [Ctenocephalides felis]